jgi:putative membrane protein
MYSLITRLLLNILALLLVAYVVPGIVVDGFFTALIVAVLLGLLNIFIKPILVLLTLPITILTLGLFTFVINALLFWFVASFVEGFAVSGFWIALLGTILYSIVSGVGSKLID